MNSEAIKIRVRAALPLTIALFATLWALSFTGPVAVTYPDPEPIRRAFRPSHAALISIAMAFIGTEVLLRYGEDTDD